MIASYCVRRIPSQSSLSEVELFRRLECGAKNADSPRSYEVEDILLAIDALNPGQPNRQGTNQTSSGFIGGFGVFHTSENNNRAVDLEFESLGFPQVQSPPQEETHSPIAICDDQNTNLDCASGVSQNVAETITSGADPTSMTQLCEIQRPFIFPFKESLGLASAEDDIDIDQLDQLDQLDAFNLENDELNHVQGHSIWNFDLAPVVPQAPPPSYLSSNERLLMHYYTTRVVHTFPALDSPKSPWKTFHLPRALQSAGEMAVQGSTCVIRSALRNTLLSISAFYLSKHMRCQSQIDEATKWETEAMHFHGTAMNLLNESVNARFTSPTRPKYKEVLATMLSMVSINVMSGDTASCGLHLEGASRLITEAAKWKSQYSNKAIALHRIYFYLRTIYDSTAIRVPRISENIPDTWNAAASPLSNAASELIDGIELNTSPYPKSYGVKQTGDYESIYAIPKSLLVFLARTTELINAVSDARERSGNTHITSPLAERCDELETSIMDWRADPIAADVTSSPVANANIIHNMTRAFHKALIIFFAQHIRLLGHRYLKPFVEDVIDSIEAVESIKVEWQVSASPLYWPAFIAASEAFDPHLQERFQRWYAQVEPNAIGSMSTGICLLEQVWAEGPSTGSHRTSLWRHIAMRTDTKLMLN
ncbi:uncharacterized protein N7483_001342 [Penicillium malachiteum]|uniref:uncharacterized protein n=1 Tax=Penicillium malachiteum TaxID=1324776 RepID=UPI0025481773|nr:uncharacterized protein N7483_001342 [Penicillium malachiteum]KAJ5736217.1 hypothetical protein N7483_001342 [Penicillium malachiteum]